LIEKNIITSLPDKNNIPLEIEKSFSKMKRNNPHWNFQIFDNVDLERIMSEEFPEYEKYFFAINEEFYVARTDLFRLLWIYKYGGIWIDAKVKINSLMDHLVGKFDVVIFARPSAFAGLGSLGSIATQFFAFSKNNPTLLEIIESVINRIETYNLKFFRKNRISLRNQILTITGPSNFRDVLWYKGADNLKVYKQETRKITWSVFEPKKTNFWSLTNLHREKLNIETPKEGVLINKEKLK
jgi:mannosyltransferase OCH1-like enzyme